MEVDLKAYTARAKELEAAIYTQKRLMTSQSAVIKEQHPKEPQKKQITPPHKPQSIHKEVKVVEQGEGLAWFCSISAIVAGLCFVLSHLDDFGFLVVLGLVVAAAGVFMTVQLVKGYRKRVEDAKRLQQLVDAARENYPILLARYQKEVAAADEQYQHALESYNINVSKHNQRYNDTMSNHNLALQTLENALAQLYAENIIYPKYRNLIAIAAINEYLMSGRCDTLEGADGAYNLYEMELRQNIIISQLSSIINNLEQIRNNQYSLYEELSKSNYTINEILSETRRMGETSKLTAYFAGVTALAETSPKYYHGIIM